MIDFGWNWCFRRRDFEGRHDNNYSHYRQKDANGLHGLNGVTVPFRVEEERRLGGNDVLAGLKLHFFSQDDHHFQSQSLWRRHYTRIGSLWETRLSLFRRPSTSNEESPRIRTNYLEIITYFSLPVSLVSFVIIIANNQTLLNIVPKFQSRLFLFQFPFTPVEISVPFLVSSA